MCHALASSGWARDGTRIEGRDAAYGRRSKAPTTKSLHGHREFSSQMLAYSAPFDAEWAHREGVFQIGLVYGQAHDSWSAPS